MKSLLNCMAVVKRAGSSQKLKRANTRQPSPEFRTGVTGLSLLCLAAILCGLLPESFQPVCLYRRVSGIPCFSCGSTRAAEYVLAGDVVAAFRIQPLATAAFLFAALYGLYLVLVLLSPCPRVSIKRWGRRQSVLLFAVGAILATLNWCYLIYVGV